MAKSIFLLNGPPSSGKDTVCKILFSHHGAEVYWFARRLKVLTHQFYGINAPWDAFEKKKDVPSPEFLNQTPRQAYIDISENKVKPMFGKTVWSERVLADILRDGHVTIALADTGFGDELDPFIDKFGEENICLIRLHREGCDFSKDSRGYIDRADLKHIFQYDITNDTIDGLRSVLRNRIIPEFMHR